MQKVKEVNVGGGVGSAHNDTFNNDCLLQIYMKRA